MPKIYVIGIGPGDMAHMTFRAKEALEESDLIVGYGTYIDLIQEHFPHKELVRSQMKREVERCRLVLQKALEGNCVALISSGDSGIYGMAGIMLEVMAEENTEIPVEVIPGVTAASAAAAILGAPMMHDFAVISLSDLLTPWETIEKRLEYAALGDFVVCIYNPKSRNRQDYIGIARSILLRNRKPDTPVGIVRNAGRKNESMDIATLENMLDFEIDMFTLVIVGNPMTYVEGGRIITPRGYQL